MSYSTNPSPIKYRPEIDGLRAIAVLAVVLFHGELTFDSYAKGWNPFKGGFIGIDIFFVISGYLITSIILQEAAAGSFSLRDFWLRRIKRLVPALVFVVLATLPFAGYFMPYSMVEEYVGSAWSALGFVSNFWFLFEEGYWASPAKLKPLLHTWSLGVEAQFYLVFAPLLWAVWRFGYVFGVIAGLSVASLVAAQVLSSYYPNEVFFLLPTRFWELGAGALLAKLELTHPPKSHPNHNNHKKHNRLANLLPTVGLLMIVLPIYFYEGELDHPPLLNLIPVAGTMLIIRFSGTRGEPTTRLLTSKPFVGLGLVSYSFYLWHQPLFALVRIDDYTDAKLTTDLEILKYTGVALLLAVVSYFLVEKPFRRFKLHKLKSKGARVAAASTVVWVLASLWGMNEWQRTTYEKIVAQNKQFNQDTYKSNFEGTKLAHGGERCSNPVSKKRYQSNTCSIGSQSKAESFVVLGNSHTLPAADVFERLALKYNKSGTLSFSNGCVPLVNTQSKKHYNVRYRRCVKLVQDSLELLKDNKGASVFLISTWRWWKKSTWLQIAQEKGIQAKTPQETFIKVIKDIFDEYFNAGADEIVVLLMHPKQRIAPQVLYEKFITNKKDKPSDILEWANRYSVSREAYAKKNSFIKRAFDEIAQGDDRVHIIDPIDVFCDKRRCPMTDVNGSFYEDLHHLSFHGFGRLEPLFEPIFAKMGE